MALSPWSLVWEIPLASLSFLFNKLAKLVIGNLYTLYLQRNPDKASHWRLLSAETLASPLSLPVLMTKGPRWNTHAIIGTLGPFTVQENITIDLAAMGRSAKSWILVIYSFPDYATIQHLTPDQAQVKVTENWHQLTLAAGQYSLGLRYYGWSEEMALPAVQVDGKSLVEAVPISTQTNVFYKELIQKKNGFYLALHYYIFTILRLRQWLPESFVEREYLPVGAPATKFFYHYLAQGQTLQIEVAPEILQQCDLYFTLYDRSSLPLDWFLIENKQTMVKPSQQNGYYLIRTRPKDICSPNALDVDVLRGSIDDSNPSNQILTLNSKLE